MREAMRLIAGVATLLSALCFGVPAFAHASLVSTEPGDGSVVAQAPKTVQLRFNEAVTPAVIRLTDATGKARDDAAVSSSGETVFIALPDDLPRGTQVVSYRVISADGHPVAGSILFSIGAVSGTPAIPESGGAAGLIWLARIGVYLGLFAGVGGAFFGGWIGPPHAASHVIRAALIIGLFCAAASLGLLGLDLLDLPLRAIETAAPWRAAAATSLLPSMLIACAAMTAGLIARRSRSVPLVRTLSALALAGAGLSLAASGHAASAPPQWLTRSMVFLHGAGVAFWVGALAPLAAMAWRRDEKLLPGLNRFSGVAVPVVGFLLLSGLTLSVVQLGNLDALTETNYGLILLVKMGLVAILLALAVLNRFRLTPALAAAPLDAAPLLRSIAAECVVVAGILAAVACWRFTPPPRALAAAVTPLAIHIHTENAMFQVLVSPGTVGVDSFVLQLMNGDASPLTAKEAVLTLSLPERGIEPIERAATLGPDGYWHVRDVPLPYPGHWHVSVDALVTDFRKVTLEDDFELPAP
jgi:copper transport protein